MCRASIIQRLLARCGGRVNGVTRVRSWVAPGGDASGNVALGLLAAAGLAAVIRRRRRTP